MRVRVSGYLSAPTIKYFVSTPDRFNETKEVCLVNFTQIVFRFPHAVSSVETLSRLRTARVEKDSSLDGRLLPTLLLLLCCPAARGHNYGTSYPILTKQKNVIRDSFSPILCSVLSPKCSFFKIVPFQAKSDQMYYMQ
jgi:hypothetical protein